MQEIQRKERRRGEYTFLKEETRERRRRVVPKLEVPSGATGVEVMWKIIKESKEPPEAW